MRTSVFDLSLPAAFAGCRWLCQCVACGHAVILSPAFQFHFTVEFPVPLPTPV